MPVPAPPGVAADSSESLRVIRRECEIAGFAEALSIPESLPVLGIPESLPIKQTI